MIIVKLMGGLGNQMFQYALGRVLSLKHETELYLDLRFLLDRTPRKNFVFRDFDLSIFDVDAKCVRGHEDVPLSAINSAFFKHVNKLVPVKYRRYYTERNFTFNPQVNELSDNVYLEGYWQSFLYFKDYVSLIKTDFSFKELLIEKEGILLKKIQESNSVCLNVRRADFLLNSHHGVCDTSYFEKGVEYISSKESNIELYIFSDDIEWCKNNFKFKFRTHFIDHSYAGIKFGSYLQLMSNCKHYIIPNSTFGWWAAWLSTSDDKIVVAPRKWFADSTINTSDLIPENWVRM